MPPGDPPKKRATLADLMRAEEEGRRVELLAGELVDKEAAGSKHGGAHGGVYGTVFPPFRGRGDGGRPGGWVFKIDPSILAPNGDVVCPDVAGWRRERAPPDDTFPIEVAPDWVCEVVYSSHHRDVVYKPNVYQSMRVGHYWVLDLKGDVLTVYRLGPDGYILATAVGPKDRARLEPFEAVELPAWELFGLEEPPEGAGEPSSG